MVLLFLGSWRSTLIIALTIPLSVLAAVLGLRLMGETLNLMTLGGLALSVGILVDLQGPKIRTTRFSGGPVVSHSTALS